MIDTSKTALGRDDLAARPNPIPPASSSERSVVVPVVRDHHFSSYRPERISITRTSSDLDDRYELRLQSLARRELSQRLNLLPGSGLNVIDREVRMEVVDFASIELTLPQVLRLRNDLSRMLSTATPRPEDDARQHLTELAAQIEVADTELSRRTWKLRRPDIVSPETRELETLNARVEELVQELGAKNGEAGMAPRHAAAAWFDQFAPAPRPWSLAIVGRGTGVAVVIGLLVIGAGIVALTWQTNAAVATSQPAPDPSPVVDAAPNLPPVTLHASDVPVPGPAAEPEATQAKIDTPPAPTPAPFNKVIPLPSARLAPEPGGSAPHRVLRARAETWVRVRDLHGRVYVARTLKPGESWVVPPAADLQLTAGNAGSTSLIVDGVNQGVIGAEGAVVTKMLPR